MRPLPPNTAFRQLLLLALTACASKAQPPEEAPAPEPSVDQQMPMERGGSSHYSECELAGWMEKLNLSPAEPVDGLVARSHWVGQERPGSTAELLAPCTQAADPPACKEALAALPAGAIRSSSTQMGQSAVDLVWSRGDAVGVVADRPGLVAYLGELDTPDEAVLLAWADGYSAACDRKPEKTAAGWTLPATQMVNQCPVTTDSYDLLVAPDGSVAVQAEYKGTPSSVCIGRLPPGLCALPEAPGMGAWLARVAHLEAAAVVAFDQIVAELVSLNAPSSLVDAARSARQDEVRHAQIFAELAAQWGALVEPVPAETQPLLGALALALDNAREGLVRERYGAAVGLWQARHAADPQVREAMREVALDEVRHAEFSIALDRWLRTRLSAAETTLVDAEIAQACVDLAPTRATEPAVAAHVGLPEPKVAAALFARITAPSPVAATA